MELLLRNRTLVIYPEFFRAPCRKNCVGLKNDCTFWMVLTSSITMKRLGRSNNQAVQCAPIKNNPLRLSRLPPKSYGFLVSPCATFPPRFVKISQVVVQSLYHWVISSVVGIFCLQDSVAFGDYQQQLWGIFSAVGSWRSEPRVEGQLWKHGSVVGIECRDVLFRRQWIVRTAADCARQLTRHCC